MSSRLFAALAAGMLLYTGTLHAEDLYCEVMSVEGTVTLSNATTSGKPLEEGDLLVVDDVVEVGPSSYADLAYDRDWNNVTRVEENSSIRIRALYPTTVELSNGGLFAKLKSLPKDSSFEVQTPTAIASVRGTEYRTTYLEGETQVYNVSDSDVYVYGMDASGQKQEAEPVVVRHSEKTQVMRRGDAPAAPHRMENADIEHAAKFRQGIESKIRHNVERGRVGKLPDVGEIGRRIQERRQSGEEGRADRERPGQPKTMTGDEASDSTRRMRSLEGGSSKGGLAEPFFPGGERQRHDAGPDKRERALEDRPNKGSDNGSNNSPQVRRREQNQPGQQNHPQDGPQGKSKSGQAKPSARPRAQR